MRRSSVVSLVLVLAIVVASCSTNDGRTMKAPGANQGESVAVAPTTTVDAGADGNGSVMTITTPWKPGAAIPSVRWTCDGDNVSPPVTWSGGPIDASAYAVILTDLDAPEFAHWTVANIDASATGIPEGDTGDLSVVAMNSDAKPAYTGPCPPEGSTHHYSLTVYALSQVLEVQEGDPAPAMRAAIEAAAIESATSDFTFSR